MRAAIEGAVGWLNLRTFSQFFFHSPILGAAADRVVTLIGTAFKAATKSESSLSGLR